jgi:hypothetical protein
VLAAADLPCPGDGCTRLSDPGRGGGADMAGWSVCLAVVAGFAVTLLLAAAVAALTRRDDSAPLLVGRAGGGPRAPPGLLPVGLTLATMSVLRT